MFDDSRGKRVILVAHCLLNQNAKIDRCAFYPGVIREATQLIMDSGAGMLQIPCPEMICLGLDRQANPQSSASVEEEDIRVAEAMKDAGVSSKMTSLAGDLIYQVLQYRKHGFDVQGLVGINGSPTCAMETTWHSDGPQAGPGAFMALL